MAATLTSLLSLAQGSFWSESTGRRTDAPTTEVSQFKSYDLDVKSLEQWLSQGTTWEQPPKQELIAHAVSPHA